MSEQKTYVPGSVKEIPTNYGGILKMSMPVDDLKKLIDEHAQNGWITFAIAKRKTVGEKGQTHSAWVDKWKPNPEASGSRKATVQAQAGANLEESGSDDVPF